MRIGSLILLAVILTGCGLRTPTAMRRVRLAIHHDPIAFLPVRAAERFGYYRREHLDVDVAELAAGPKAIEALVGGSVDVAAASVSDVVQLAARQRYVTSFLLLYTRPFVALATAPGSSDAIRRVQDLKGHIVGVSAPGSASHQFLNFLLTSNGLTPQDVSVASVGMAATSLAALEHGKVDAAVLLGGGIGAYEERHGEGAFIIDTRSANGARRVFGSEAFPSLGLVAREEWLRGEADTARRLCRAVMDGMRWVRDHPAEDVRALIPDDAHLASVASELRSIREMQQVISEDGAVPSDAMERLKAFVAASDPSLRTAHVDLHKISTNEFLSAR
jgi:NitT/TauT family transport system substrate-binding protein